MVSLFANFTKLLGLQQGPARKSGSPAKPVLVDWFPHSKGTGATHVNLDFLKRETEGVSGGFLGPTQLEDVGGP